MFLPKEQHQALLYQLVQQHHQPDLQQLQIPAPTQMPINNLLAGTQAPPLHPATTNPFLTIHGDNASQKVTVSVCALLQLVKYQNEFYWLIRDDCPAPLFLPTRLKIYYPPDNFFLKPVVSAPGYCKHKGPKLIYISSKYISLNLHVRLEDCFIIQQFFKMKMCFSMVW